MVILALFFRIGRAMWWWRIRCFGMRWHLVNFSLLTRFWLKPDCCFCQKNSNVVLWAVRDCISSQQLVDFIYEHINTVSTKLFNIICHFEKMLTPSSDVLGLSWQTLMERGYKVWEESLSVLCERVLDRCLAPSTMGDEWYYNMMILVQFKKPIARVGDANGAEQPAGDAGCSETQWVTHL